MSPIQLNETDSDSVEFVPGTPPRKGPRTKTTMRKGKEVRRDGKRLGEEECEVSPQLGVKAKDIRPFEGMTWGKEWKECK